MQQALQTNSSMPLQINDSNQRLSLFPLLPLNLANDILILGDLHTNQLPTSCGHYHYDEQVPSKRIYDEEESESKKNTLIYSLNPPRRDRLLDFLNNLVILNDSMTIIIDSEKLINDLQTSMKEADAGQNSTRVLLSPDESWRSLFLLSLRCLELL